MNNATSGNTLGSLTFSDYAAKIGSPGHAIESIVGMTLLVLVANLATLCIYLIRKGLISIKLNC